MARRMVTAGTGRAPFAERGDDLYCGRTEVQRISWEPATCG